MKRAAYVFVTVCLAFGVLEAALWAAVLVWLVTPFFGLGLIESSFRFLPVALAVGLVAFAWAVAVPRSGRAIKKAYSAPVPEAFTNLRYLLALLSLVCASVAVASFVAQKFLAFSPSPGASSFYFYTHLAAILLALLALPNAKNSRRHYDA
jgi:predicted transporter